MNHRTSYLCMFRNHKSFSYCCKGFTTLSSSFPDDYRIFINKFHRSSNAYFILLERLFILVTSKVILWTFVLKNMFRYNTRLTLTLIALQPSGETQVVRNVTHVISQRWIITFVSDLQRCGTSVKKSV